MSAEARRCAAQPAVAADGLLGLRSRSPQLNVKYVGRTKTMTSNKIPLPVIATVAAGLGNYSTHTRLNMLFIAAGAPGEPPGENREVKCDKWLRRCNDDPSVDPLEVLAGILKDVMEKDWGLARPLWLTRIEESFATHGLQYSGGRVLRMGLGPSAKTLEDYIRARDLVPVNAEFRRIEKLVDTDPAGALTASCSLLESLFKIYLVEHKIQLPAKETIAELYKAIRKMTSFGPGGLPAEDIAKLAGSLSGVVETIGTLRTHCGSAHGRGLGESPVAPRHARFAANAAHAVAVLVLESWSEEA